MNKKIVLILIVLINLLLLNSCGVVVGEEKKANTRMEQIVSAIKDRDSEALKSLFSKKAIDASNDFEGGVDSLFNIIQGNITSSKIDDGWSSGESMGGGKSSLVIRFGFHLKTDKDVYSFFVIDYSNDTIDPDNQGVYMLELIKFTDEKELDSWQDRMRAGIYIH